MRKTAIKNILLLFPIFLFSTAARTQAPDWAVNPANYSHNKNLIGQLLVNGTADNSAGNIIGIFVNGEVRGVATGSPVGPFYYYFLTAYSNTPSTDVLSFKVYLAAEDQVFDLVETIAFNAINSSIIYELNTNVSSDYPISLDSFPNPTQVQGFPFDTIDLPNYLVQIDDDPIVWTYSGNSNLNVSISNEQLIVSSPNPAWTGSETITITATEQTPNSYHATQNIVYTISPNYGPPDLGTVSDQTIGLNQSFETVDLNDALAPYPGDSLYFHYFMPQTMGVDSDAGWSVNPASFQYNMNITAQVKYGSTAQNASGSKLLAFIDGTLAGVSSPILSNGIYFYFLTVYANTNNQSISYQFYDQEYNQLYAIETTHTFQSGADIGSPDEPLFINTAPLEVLPSSTGQMAINIVPNNWVGQQQIAFIAADGYQAQVNADTSAALFEVLNESAPVVGNIPDQYVEIGQPFTPFDLDNYLTELDGNLITWSYSGDHNLQVSMDAQNVISIVPLVPTWTGAESITFRVSDQSSAALFTETTVLFTISMPNQAPEILAIPEQVISLGEDFSSLDLNDFLNEPNGDEVEWTYHFTNNISNGESVNWTINPSSFAFNMSLTTKIKVRDSYPIANNHQLAAFHDGELRGVANAQQFGGEWLFFLSIYSNQVNDSIYFKYFHDDQTAIFAVSDSLKFVSQQTIGSVNDPFEMEAGYLSIAESQDTLYPSLIDKEWIGSDTLIVVAKEIGTIEQHADTSAIVFTVNGGPTLPIDLLSFTGEKKEQTSLLQWVVANPDNFMGFEIHRATINPINGILEWSTIGFQHHIPGKDHYEFIDPLPDLAENYYRLRLVDLDGAFSWSNIISVKFEYDNKDVVSFFPNPTFGHPFHLELKTKTADFVEVQIVDTAAKNWMNIRLYSEGQRQILPLEIEHFPPGIYFARIKIGPRVLNRSFSVVSD